MATLLKQVRISMASGATYVAKFNPASTLEEVLRYVDANPVLDVTDRNGKRVVISTRMIESVGEV